MSIAIPDGLIGNEVSPRIFNVRSSTVPIALAKAVAKVLRQQHALEMQTVGVGAVYRATLALTIARVLLAKDNLDLRFRLDFGETTIGGETFVGVIFEVERRSFTGISPIRLDQY